MSDDDERARWFRREVLPLQPRLKSIARRFMRASAKDPDDLVHDVLLRMFTLDRWRAVDRPLSYAAQTLRNLVLAEVRHRKVVPIVPLPALEWAELADDRPGADREAEARDDLRLLQELIDALPPQCRRVVTLKKIHGLSNAEIAETMGLSISTVEKHLVKGLRTCLQQWSVGTAAPSDEDCNSHDRSLADHGRGRALGRTHQR